MLITSMIHSYSILLSFLALNVCFLTLRVSGLQLRGKQLSPIILIPGYGGSKLEARWTQRHIHRSENNCERSTDWRTIWVEYQFALPGRSKCLLEQLELTYNRFMGTTHDKQGLEVRVKDFDKVESVEYLTDHRVMGFQQFSTLVTRLVGALDYKRDESIRGAPYDFRRAPNELGGYFYKLKLMVEEMSRKSDGHQAVTLICHSMGCLNALYFLQHQHKAWKNRHIRRLVTIGAPWGGSVAVLRFIALGCDMMPGIDGLALGKAARTFPSSYLLFPNEKVFGNRTLIQHNIGSSKMRERVTANNYGRFLGLIDHYDGIDLLSKTKYLLKNLKAPGVEVHCYYGSGTDTLARMQFSGEFPKPKEIQHFQDGDGSVTTDSASYCQNWTNEQSEPVDVHAFRNSHFPILKDQQMLERLIRVLRRDRP